MKTKLYLLSMTEEEKARLDLLARKTDMSIKAVLLLGVNELFKRLLKKDIKVKKEFYNE